MITTAQVYTDYLHEIEESTIDKNLNENTVANWSLLSIPNLLVGDVERKTRTSLTFRDVLRVAKIKI